MSARDVIKYTILPKLYYAREIYTSWAIGDLEVGDDASYMVSQLARVNRLIVYYEGLL